MGLVRNMVRCGCNREAQERGFIWLGEGSFDMGSFKREYTMDAYGLQQDERVSQ